LFVGSAILINVGINAVGSKIFKFFGVGVKKDYKKVFKDYKGKILSKLSRKERKKKEEDKPTTYEQHM